MRLASKRLVEKREMSVRFLRGIVPIGIAVGLLIGGCGRSPENPQISAASFRADPSRMTPEEKANYDKLMNSGGKAASTPKPPATK